MARPLGQKGRVNLSPRARLIGGWLVALLLVLGVAAAVGVFGERGDGTTPLQSAAASASSTPLAITFGTALDEERTVTSASRTTRFAPGDTFAYSVAEAEPASAVYVSVERVAGGEAGVVQPAVDAQEIPQAPNTIGFTVAADALFDAFGPGTYLMRIFLEPDGAVVAEGRFELVGPAPSGAP